MSKDLNGFALINMLKECQVPTAKRIASDVILNMSELLSSISGLKSTVSFKSLGKDLAGMKLHVKE